MVTDRDPGLKCQHCRNPLRIVKMQTSKGVANHCKYCGGFIGMEDEKNANRE